MNYSSINSVIEDIKKGIPVIVIDNEDRENEGDLVIASELVSPDNINFMAKEGRGLICVSITSEKAAQLDLEPMESRNSSLHETNFTISIDAKKKYNHGHFCL